MAGLKKQSHLFHHYPYNKEAIQLILVKLINNLLQFQILSKLTCKPKCVKMNYQIQNSHNIIVKIQKIKHLKIYKLDMVNKCKTRPFLKT